jgi:carbonic anhydrase
MNNLLTGLHQFHNRFGREREFYSKLAAGQHPSALFIGCSDSRVDPSIITQTGLGELFVMRNAGNIVPCYGASNGGEPATIEYAVSALGVKDIIVCGHSGCGAIQAMLHPETMAKLPSGDPSNHPRKLPQADWRRSVGCRRQRTCPGSN